MKVKDHKKFCKFDYESDTAKHTYELGDVVTKESEDGIEIGVVIQLHEDGDFRTDMFGNASPSEVTMSTIEEVAKFRDELFDDLYLHPDFKGNFRDSINLTLIKNISDLTN